MNLELLWVAMAQPTCGGSLNGLHTAFKLPWNPSLQKLIQHYPEQQVNIHYSVEACGNVRLKSTVKHTLGRWSLISHHYAFGPAPFPHLRRFCTEAGPTLKYAEDSTACTSYVLHTSNWVTYPRPPYCDMSSEMSVGRIWRGLIPFEFLVCVSAPWHTRNIPTITFGGTTRSPWTASTSSWIC